MAIRRCAEPATLKIAGNTIVSNGAAMPHMILGYHQKTLRCHEGCKVIITLYVLSDAVNDLQHRPGFPGRLPPAAVNHALSAGRVIKVCAQSESPHSTT